MQINTEKLNLNLLLFYTNIKPIWTDVSEPQHSLKYVSSLQQIWVFVLKQKRKLGKLNSGEYRTCIWPKVIWKAMLQFLDKHILLRSGNTFKLNLPSNNFPILAVIWKLAESQQKSRSCKVKNPLWHQTLLDRQTMTATLLHINWIWGGKRSGVQRPGYHQTTHKLPIPKNKKKSQQWTILFYDRRLLLLH